MCYRFAHFFISPLLNKTSSEAEIQAVDSGKAPSMGRVCTIRRLLWAGSVVNVVL